MPAPSPIADLDALTRALGGVAPTWRGRAAQQLPAQSTGFAALDALLPGGGWPTGALTELCPVLDGIGELSLTLPALRQLCRVQRRVIFIDPPFLPHPPALQGQGLPLQRLLWLTAGGAEARIWAAAQLLRETATGAVLLWGTQGDDRSLRKLQLAAENGGSLAFLFRAPTGLETASPAALRLELKPAQRALQVRLHKGRGARPGTALIDLPRGHLPRVDLPQVHLPQVHLPRAGL